MWNSLFEGEVLEDASLWSPVTTLHDRLDVHAFEYKITGAGTVDIEVYISISGEVWISNGVKASGVGSGSGPGTNGSDIIPLRLKPGDLFKVKATAIGAVVLSAWFTQK